MLKTCSSLFVAYPSDLQKNTNQCKEQVITILIYNTINNRAVLFLYPCLMYMITDSGQI